MYFTVVLVTRVNENLPSPPPTGLTPDPLICTFFATKKNFFEFTP